MVFPAFLACADVVENGKSNYKRRIFAARKFNACQLYKGVFFNRDFCMAKKLFSYIVFYHDRNGCA